ncbi:hypothetical protein Acife_1928 [Acidithiobacillus ferrivorans SS3]|uniref:Uncharacterized protein n=1 Tax=Acidithiobacillus ferrivorans SS3 TaxID=743299 RepID=G0JLK2_9PROT|nr:hypothetical protein Acife_1928 [Acidithiobacillus ferrivorans SS3]
MFTRYHLDADPLSIYTMHASGSGLVDGIAASTPYTARRGQCVVCRLGTQVTPYMVYSLSTRDAVLQKAWHSGGYLLNAKLRFQIFNFL